MATTVALTTALQLITPPLMRGRMAAAFVLLGTVVGMGVGPLLIGILSDHVFKRRLGIGAVNGGSGYRWLGRFPHSYAVYAFSGSHDDN